jgi:hypothetical protein
MIVAVIGWFENLAAVPGAILVIGGFIVLSLAFARVVGRLFRAEMLRDHNDLTGFVFAVVGVVYAVVLGFVAVGVWERFEAAEDRTYDEASSLAAIYRDAGSFSNGARLRADVRSYADHAIHVGWPALARGETPPETPIAEKLARDVHGTPVSGERQAAIFSHMLERSSEAALDRDARLTEDSTGLNGVMWCVVLAGGFITIAFTYLFGFRQTTMQTTMIGTLALLIGLVIFLTMSLDYPFRGAIRVGPDAFERALTVFDQIDAADPLTVHTR